MSDGRATSSSASENGSTDGTPAMDGNRTTTEEPLFERVVDRLGQEWALWATHAPEALLSAGYLGVLWVLVGLLDGVSITVGLVGTGLWLLAVIGWILLGRRQREGSGLR